MDQIASRATIAARIRAALAYKGLDQVALGPVILRSESAISARLRGDREFRLHELGAVAKFLDLSVDELIAPERTEVSPTAATEVAS